MNERIMTRGFPWGEPAHPGIVRQYEDLVEIYKTIRGEYQEGIDQAFDRVSRDIGFVVSTTVPATFTVSDDRKSVQWDMAEPLKATVFHRAMMEVMKPSPDPWKNVSPGAYQLYLVWYDALKLKLRNDWLEPVHYLREEVVERISGAASVRPEVKEPAHWFLPSVTIAAEEKLLIAAIDEVYPELRLSERIAATRQALRTVRPEVREPAHPGGLTADVALRQIANLFKRVGPGIPEPAHTLALERDLLAQIEAVVRRSGF